ncbi:FtsB family cell division protein [Odoribacter lunatus]|uniref:FtsB family cell division protein n=1 Tax=Odoribacter lunatus TaxID=2941335 RepID=UPI00203F2A19|nr:septum formation inhibitor [Odoribacter lunatus]
MLKYDLSKFRKVIRRFTNKYTLVGLLFLVWISFFDKNSFVEKAQLRNKINTLTKEKVYYERRIEEDNRKMQELISNRDNLEKFAREQYLMKNEEEDIFIIIE